MVSVYFAKGTSRFFLLAVSMVCAAQLCFAQKVNPNNPPVPSVPDTVKTNLVIPQNPADTGKNANGQYLTLRQCIDYAMQHQPGVNIAKVNIEVTKATNAAALGAWLPQANASGTFDHYFLTTNGNTVTNTGSKGGYANTFIPGIQVSQSIFSPALLYAYRAAPLYNKQAQQATDSTKIFLVSGVSKSFYNVLLTLEQINVLKEDTARLGQSLRDAYHQYKGGIVDETDYEEAEITLNNSVAQLKQATQNVVPQYAALKRLIGYPPEQQFNVSFDTLQMMDAIHMDTTQQLAYEKRIEYQELNTAASLQDEQVHFYRFQWLPTVSAFYNYNLGYYSNQFSALFNNSYPNSLIGLSLNIPIFTGLTRLNNLKKAKLVRQIIDWQRTDLRSQIYQEYTSALANYKSDMYSLKLLQKNVALARRSYFVVTLQYKQGIVPYLNVITAESNLITSEINYLNDLFQVMSSKIDLEKAMGIINY
ncbi:MAG: TolC family protein [Bacteroidetes bacterium]|nr:TolC family protein [Bacteroidota bacterium]